MVFRIDLQFSIRLPDQIALTQSTCVVSIFPLYILQQKNLASFLTSITQRLNANGLSIMQEAESEIQQQTWFKSHFSCSKMTKGGHRYTQIWTVYVGKWVLICRELVGRYQLLAMAIVSHCLIWVLESLPQCINIEILGILRRWEHITFWRRISGDSSSNLHCSNIVYVP